LTTRFVVAEGKPIPSELRGEERELRKQIALDDASTTASAAASPRIDDEYARAGVQDPRIFITTSRNPSNKLMQFAKGAYCFRFVFFFLLC
jgi:U3 small nucleolar ribonucleoprotein protein IMP4